MSKQTTIRKKLTRSRVRKKISGSTERPRLSVRISNINVTAQLIDDTTGKTLAYVSTIGNKSVASKNMTDKSKWAGEEIAKSAKAAKISTVVKILISISLRKLVRTPFLKPQAKPSSHINIKIKKVYG